MDAASFVPAVGRVSLAAEGRKGYTRFQFSKVCAHWDHERNGRGKAYCYILVLREQNRVPFRSNGMFWWVDVRADELGGPGEKVKIYTVTSFDGGDGRGLKGEEYKAKDGMVAQAFGGVAEWEVVA